MFWGCCARRFCSRSHLTAWFWKGRVLDKDSMFWRAEENSQAKIVDVRSFRVTVAFVLTHARGT